MSGGGTQTSRIIRALLTGRKLTPITALHEFRCFRLGARIWDARRILGAEFFARRLVKTPGGAAVAEYYIPPEKLEEARKVGREMGFCE